MHLMSDLKKKKSCILTVILKKQGLGCLLCTWEAVADSGLQQRPNPVWLVLADT